MDSRVENPAAKKSKSRIFYAVMSLIFPGLGQIARGRIFAGLLFLLNTAIYITPLFVAQNEQYDVQTPALLVAVGVWLCSALDAFLSKSSFLVMALLVSLLCFGVGFFGSYFILPHLDV